VFPYNTTDMPHLKVIQAGSVAHATSNSTGTVGSFSRSIMAR